MTTVLITYSVYLVLSAIFTVWVGRTLARNGLVFLIRAFGEEALGKSVNHLLVVGFYLINLGFVGLFMSVGTPPEGAVEGFEYTVTKLGVVLVVLGVMHFFNVFNFAKIYRKRARKEAQAASQAML